MNKKEEVTNIEVDKKETRTPFQERYYHKTWLKYIRNVLGKECSYLSFVKSNTGQFGLKAKINNKPVYIYLEGSPEDINDNSYNDLLQQLNNVKEEGKNN